jgi:hypothetical protein
MLDKPEHPELLIVMKQRMISGFSEGQFYESRYCSGFHGLSRRRYATNPQAISSLGTVARTRAGKGFEVKKYL